MDLHDVDQVSPIKRSPGQGKFGTTQDKANSKQAPTHSAHTVSDQPRPKSSVRFDGNSRDSDSKDVTSRSSTANSPKRSDGPLPVFGCDHHAHELGSGVQGVTGDMICEKVESRVPARSLRDKSVHIARSDRPHSLRESHVLEPDELGRASTASSHSWRGGSSGLGEVSTEASADRDRGRGRDATSDQRSLTSTTDGSEHQQGSPPQGGLTKVREGGVGRGPHRNRNGGDPQDEGPEPGVQQHPWPCGRPRGIWAMVPPQIPRSEDTTTGILPAGVDDCSRRPVQSATPSLGRLAEDGGEQRGPAHAGEEGLHLEDTQSSDGAIIEHHADAWPGGRSQSHAPELDGDREESLGRHGTGEAECQGGQTPHPPCRGRHFYERLGSSVGAAVGEPPKAYELSEGELMDAPECQSRELSLSEIRTLSWKAERLLPECMEALVQARKPILFELACAPDSVLTKQMQQITNRPSSAQRFAYWNGYDIGTNTGVRAILVAIKKQRPEHVWISTECGPFSRMQQVNQRNEKQVLELNHHVGVVRDL